MKLDLNTFNQGKQDISQIGFRHRSRNPRYCILMEKILQLGPAIPGDAEISVDQQLLLMLSKEARVQKGPGKTLRLKLAAQVPEISYRMSMTLWRHMQVNGSK